MLAHDEQLVDMGASRRGVELPPVGGAPGRQPLFSVTQRKWPA
jgi:hypothetical protein